MLASLARLQLPCLVPGIERVRHGPDDLMVRAPRPLGAVSYLRLEPADERLLDLMDGTRTPSEILLENFRNGGGLAIARLNRLLEALGQGGFLVKPTVDVYAGLARRLRPPRRRTLLSLLRLGPAQLLSIHLLTWRNADSFFERAYGAGGWVLFQSWFIVVATLTALIGFALLTAEARRLDLSLRRD